MRSDDAATARQAVMEGQASWLMTAYLSKKSGGPGEVSDAVLDLMTHSMEVSPEEYPVFSKAPPYIQEMLVFPYADGMVFQNAVFQKLGRAAFAEVFQHPPASTQQIIHPDRYLAHVQPQIPDPPQVPGAREFRRLAEGTLGELDYRILLTQYAGKEEGQSRRRICWEVPMRCWSTNTASGRRSRTPLPGTRLNPPEVFGTVCSGDAREMEDAGD